ncbi:MAG TPA: type II toxin-antitoxin system prevent-host-death family antitoxin [bacterium]|jgi:prevent-host-death family protein|nr:type II toxin-antitoxin system prevent-host-death family antitoxin [bacterium]
MKVASVRDFKTKATQYLNDDEEVVVTRHGKPIALLTHVKPKSAAASLLEMRSILNNAGVSKKELLKMLEDVRKEVYRR